MTGAARSSCQEGIPEVLKNGTIPEQLKFLEEKTRIYENYRAIREDMFRTISRNTLDTLANAKKRINGLVMHTSELDARIDSLKKGLEITNNELVKAATTKNSISVLGLEVNKKTYNSVMWTILAALTFLLIAGYMTFRLNRVVTVKTRKDLEDLKAEFEEYRTKSRLDREKMNIDHFNEMKRLKGGLPNRG
jgi:hypothetical protein